MKALKTIGKTMAALLAGILMPVLIWVALGVALYSKLTEGHRKPVPNTSLGQMIAAAGNEIKR